MKMTMINSGLKGLTDLIRWGGWPCRPLRGRRLLYSFYPKKINMALTESDLDPKVWKMSITFNDCAGCHMSIWACDWNVTDTKNHIFDLIIRGQILDMTVQRNVQRFCTGSICGWNLFQPLGLGRGYNPIPGRSVRQPIIRISGIRCIQTVDNPCQWPIGVRMPFPAFRSG